MPIGIAHHTWVRGVVIKLEGNKIVVRITEPGASGAAVGNAELKKGSVMLDAPDAWTPCM